MSLDDLDPRRVKWNKEALGEEWNKEAVGEFGEKIIREGYEGEKHKGAHNNRSCEVDKDENLQILTKFKNRSYEAGQLEYDSLKMWRDILDDYRAEEDVNIKSPTPVFEVEGAEESEPGQFQRDNPALGMEFLSDDVWSPIKGNKDIIKVEAAEEAEEICYQLGQLAKIMENEGLLHGDIQGRHILVNESSQDIGVIDLEGLFRAQNEMQLSLEQSEIRENVLYQIAEANGYDEGTVDSWFEDGYESLPNRPVSGKLDQYGFDGFEEDYDFEKLGDSIEYVFD